MLRAKRLSAVLLALAVGGLVACGESDPTGLAGNGGGGGGGGGGNGGGGGGSGTIGAFDASVTGAADLDLSGEALWGEVDDADLGDVFVLLFGDDGAGAQIAGTVSLYLGGARPATGTYQVLDMDENAENPFVNNDFVAVVTLSQPPLFGTSLSGEVEITSSSASEVAGTFTVRAQAIGQTGSGSEVTITGSFRAIGGPVFLPE